MKLTKYKNLEHSRVYDLTNRTHKRIYVKENLTLITYRKNNYFFVVVGNGFEIDGQILSVYYPKYHGKFESQIEMNEAIKISLDIKVLYGELASQWLGTINDILIRKI